MGRRRGEEVPSELITSTPTTIYEFIKWMHTGEKLLQLQREQFASETPSLYQLTMVRPARHCCWKT
jgi:hypothetical protein